MQNGTKNKKQKQNKTSRTGIIFFAEVRLRARMYIGGRTEKRPRSTRLFCCYCSFVSYMYILFCFVFFFFSFFCLFGVGFSVCFYRIAVSCFSLSHFQSWYDRWGATAGHRTPVKTYDSDCLVSFEWRPFVENAPTASKWCRRKRQKKRVSPDFHLSSSLLPCWPPWPPPATPAAVWQDAFIICPQILIATCLYT